MSEQIAVQVGGRPTSLDKLGIRKEDIWNLAVEGLTNSDISKRLSRSKGKISIRTIAKYRSEMPAGYEALFDEFEKLPQIPEYKNWLYSRHDKAGAAEAELVRVKKIWEAVWNKPLDSLTEQDIIAALAWIKQSHPNSQFQYILAVRTLMRFGLGDQAWLTKHLSTKGKKGQERTLALLMSPEFFEKILPMMLEKAKELEIDERGKEEFMIQFLVKITTGIRTGNVKDQRELWGTRISEGKTSLQIRDGKISDWIVFAKKKEIWHIRFLPEMVEKLLITYVAKYKLKPGDLLISKLTVEKARDYLTEICDELQIEHLRLHDLRKVYLTGLCLSGIPLETAVDLNVGWKDLNTARKHYLQIKALNADSEYAKFSERFFK